MQVTLPFTPRPYQIPFLKAMNDGCKQACLVWHRKSGKETTCFNWMVYEMLRNVGTYYYFFPTYQQGEKVLWYGMDNEGHRWIDHYLPRSLRQRINNTDMRLELKNGSIFQVVGLDRFKKDQVVGVGLKGCVFSEYSVQDPSGWLYMQPALADTRGWVVFNFTPRGMNHAHKLYLNAIKGQDERGTWFASLLTIRDTHAISEAYINELRASGTPEEVIQQEYYCSFNAMNRGVYFGPWLDRARMEGRLTHVPYDPNLPVHTAWDLGVNDPTAIWFFQLDRGKTIRFIRYYEKGRVGVDEHFRYLKSLPYTYGCHLGPHDLNVFEWGGNTTRFDKAAAIGLDFERNRDGKPGVPKLPKDESIATAQGIFPRCVFDTTLCADGIHVLESYEEEFDDSVKVQGFTGKPGPKWATHGADAFQYGAIGIEMDMVTNDLFGRDNDEPPRIVKTEFDPFTSSNAPATSWRDESRHLVIRS